MSATITFPSSLRGRIAAIRRRTRFLRAMRGLGLLVLVLGLSGAAALLADCSLDLPALARQLIFSAWIGEGVALLLLGVVVPLCRRIDARALAALIEQKYPDLGERLTSAVELAGTSREGNGSPVLIALLMNETENQSRHLDFRPAVPARRAGVLAALAAVVVLLVAAPAFVWPQQYANLTQRFFRPWYAAPAIAPYSLEVAPGDVIAGRGRTVILSAHLIPRDETVTLPATCTLVVVDANGKETRQAMDRDGDSDFTVAYKVPSDVSYHIEVGQVISDSYRVTAVTPVELAAESPRITVTPPAYARVTKDEETFHGLVDLSSLQHSEVRFEFQFSRPAVAAYLEWSPASVGRQPHDAKNHGADAPRSPLTLSDDRQAGSFTMPAITPGKYCVVLEAEHGIRTVLEGGTISVRPDQPPAVLKFVGKEDLRAVLPYERVPLEIEVTDDIAVAGVELEYRINDGELVRQSLALTATTTGSAIARHQWELAGKVKEDDRVSYRFRVSDNFPKEYKGPHVIVYPTDRWLTLQVAKRGESLKQQEILAQRNEINQKLESIKEALLKEKRGVSKVQQESRNQASLQANQAEQVKQLENENRNSQQALRDVARTASVTPALHAIADLARDVADREMRASQQALGQAARQDSPRDRTRQFNKADEQLASAVKRLDELKNANNKLAQERLDQAKLEMLADREKQLAEQAAELAAKHPVLDSSAKEQAEKIKRRQAEAAAELERLAQQSEPLKQALAEAREQQTREMAERARELAQAQRDLAKAEAETERQRNTEHLADLARKQQELAEKAAKLAQETRRPAEAARTNPFKPEEAQRAADALKQGDPQEAVKHQDQAANDLERLAQAFDRAIKLSADPREAARQLAQAEKVLRQRVQEETAKKDAKQPPADRLKPLQAEQNAIQQAVEHLSVPPNHADSNKVKEQIAEHAMQAAEAMQKQDARQALAQMDETRNLLNRLADLLPNLEQRRQKAQQEAARLRRQQDEIARQVEQVKKDDPSAAQRLAEAARRQAEVAEALSKMDAPNQEAQREQTAEALNRALADLLDSRPKDAPASQQEARRQLERLEQALRDQKPADDLARGKAQGENKPAEQPRRTTSFKPSDQSPREMAQQMAQKQRELAKSTQQAQQASKEALQKALRQIGRQQRELNEQASHLPVNQAQRALAEARTAMSKAEQALARNDAAKGREQQAEAANALERLAKQLPARVSQATPRDRQDTPSPTLRGLPSKQQSEQARQLARQQRQLREAVQRAGEAARAERPLVPDNPVGELARQQDGVAKQAAELARNVGEEQGRDAPVAQRASQAQQAAQETARQMQAGALPKAQQAARLTAMQLRQLAGQLARTPPGKDPQTPDPLQQARQLSKRQEAINRRLQSLAGDARAQAGQQQAQQRNLQQETGELMQEFNRLARQERNSPQAQSSLQSAARASQQAQQAMQQARSQAQQGNSGQERQSQEQAAQSLDQAARNASQAASQQAASRPAGPSQPTSAPKPGSKPGSPQPGQAVSQAQQQMAQAQNQLGQAQPGKAQTAMRQAAQSLRQAAQQMAANQQPSDQSQQPGQSNARGRAAGGALDLSAFGLEKTPYAGKSWGELPGELRTRIVQDMKARYGEDYARKIKLYFEQIASTDPPASRPLPRPSQPPVR